MDRTLLPEAALKEARAAIAAGAPCAFIKDGQVASLGRGSGVAPLLEALAAAPELLRGAVVVDKVVGKAAAMLAVLGGAAGVYGLTMSAAARDYLAARGVPAGWDALTERIIDRAGTGLCPMETAVLDIEDPGAGRAAIEAARAALRSGRQV